jgi:hypothetical protein
MQEFVIAMLGGAVGGVVVGAAVVVTLGRLLRVRAAELSDGVGSSVRRAVEEGAAQVAPRLRDEVSAGVREAAEDVLPKLREEVRSGVIEGADEVVPRLREEMRQGLESAVDDVLGERLARAGRGALKTGSSVVEAGLDLLLGRDDRERD